MGALTRDAILGADDTKRAEVEVPEWGGSVTVRQMTVAERGEFARRSATEDHATIGAWLVAKLTVGPNGSALFTPDDVKALEGRNAKAIDRVVGAILKLNRLSDAEVEKAEGNS